MSGIITNPPPMPANDPRNPANDPMQKALGRGYGTSVFWSGGLPVGGPFEFVSSRSVVGVDGGFETNFRLKPKICVPGLT